MIREKEIESPNSCLNRAQPGEPVFVLRANDELAPGVVRLWAEGYKYGKGGFGKMNGDQKRKYAEALALADQMDAWKEVRS